MTHTEIDGFQLKEREELGITLGAWEVFQDRGFVEIFARHYGCTALRLQDIWVVARRLPLAGILHGSIFGPEAGTADDGWTQSLDSRPIGRLEIVTNRAISQLEEYRCSPADLYSMVKDLRNGEEAVLASFEGRARQAIRRASQGGLQVRPSKSASELRGFYVVLQRVSLGGTKYPIPPLPLLDELLSAEYARVYLAFFRGQVVGGVCMLGRRYAHGLVMGFDAKACGGLPGELLYWESMRGEIAAGVPFFDFGAQSLAANPGLLMAKRNFKPVLVPAFRYELRLSAWRCTVYSARESLRRSLRLKWSGANGMRRAIVAERSCIRQTSRQIAPQ